MPTPPDLLAEKQRLSALMGSVGDLPLLPNAGEQALLDWDVEQAWRCYLIERAALLVPVPLHLRDSDHD